MSLMLQRGSEESARHRATTLMECIITNSAVAYAGLDALYVELKVGGGFFRGRKMSPEVDDLTRNELVGYITALAVVLVERSSRDIHETASIIAALENLVFLPEWQAARLAYQRYVARYRDIGPSDSALLPRQKVLLIRFRQTLIDIWSVSPELLLEDGIVHRHCEALSMLHDGIEDRILKELDKGTNEW
ncbi:MAG TPA: hypothetical protein VJV04_03120 [Nitrospiraceae bacterium]|nr:hypothetical protein [Nitrospiraceae bacterium]